MTLFGLMSWLLGIVLALYAGILAWKEWAKNPHLKPLATILAILCFAMSAGAVVYALESFGYLRINHPLSGPTATLPSGGEAVNVEAYKPKLKPTPSVVPDTDATVKAHHDKVKAFEGK